MQSNCEFCGKLLPENYYTTCDWNCYVELAKREGGTIHQPNGLPIKCVKHDGSMWENPHGDHPNYIFPVEIEYIGDRAELSEWDADSQEHALIYTDGFVALTLYECCYALWAVLNGRLIGGKLWSPKEWRLTEASRKKIEEHTQK